MHPDSAQTWLHWLGAYPSWLVVTCAAIAVGFFLWLAARLLAWAFELIPLTLIVVGGAAVAWWLTH
ncbi:MAG TPA: hypothetical protein VFB27_12920 [Opitutaceae bacterium]|nr:hypothetical protein [Opitutaceae bacterium]